MPHYELGDYRATVTAQGFSESKTKGTPYFFLEVEPTDPLGANKMPEKIYRREIPLYVTEKRLKYVIDDLRRLGWEGTKLSELDPDTPGHHSFIDQEIEVTCTHEGDYDKFELRYNPGGQAESKPGVASKLDKLFGKALTASKPAKAATPKPAAAKAAETVPADDGDDEIPF